MMPHSLRLESYTLLATIMTTITMAVVMSPITFSRATDVAVPWPSLQQELLVKTVRTSPQGLCVMHTFPFPLVTGPGGGHFPLPLTLPRPGHMLRRGNLCACLPNGSMSRSLLSRTSSYSPKEQFSLIWMGLSFLIGLLPYPDRLSKQCLRPLTIISQASLMFLLIPLTIKSEDLGLWLPSGKGCERTPWHWSKQVKFRPSWLFRKGCLSLHNCQTAILPHVGTLNSARSTFSTFHSGIGFMLGGAGLKECPAQLHTLDKSQEAQLLNPRSIRQSVTTEMHGSIAFSESSE